MIEKIENKEKGQPCWRCSKCGKQYQTKAIGETHNRRVHNG